MKQSTKLLCLVISLIMAFSCFSVIGSAALTKADITYDNIDDAALTKEQVSTLALDLVDNDLLAGMDPIDLSIVGTLRLDSVDHALYDIYDLRHGFIWSIGKGLLGDVGDLNFNATTKDNADSEALQRAQGDYVVISQLIQFIGDNAGTLSKIAYGIGTSNGIDLGLIESFLDLGETGDLLANLPGFLTETVYDMLVYGSYKEGEENNSYMSLDALEEAGTTFGAKYPEMNTIDNIAVNALYNLLSKPQDYSWVETGETDPVTGEPIMAKEWETAIISPTFAAMDEATAKALINPMANSFFQILDNIAQIAIDDLGVIALNNNLKKALMEAVEVEFNELDYANVPAECQAMFDDEAAYVTYISYDCIAKADNGVWYYTTLKNEPVDADGDGETDLDAEDNEIYEKVRMYYKANFGAANEFASLINWDWQFCGSQGGEGTSLIFEDIKYDGTIVGGLNNLLKLVYDQALTDDVKADYVDSMAAVGINTTGWEEGGNDKLGDNITNLVKYVLANYGEKVFGKGSKYSTFTLEELAPYTIVDMVALIGPEFFEDAMPQIILPKNADGTYAFTQGKQLWEFGAIVLRELITGIAPNVNYDNYIFANGDVTSADDRLPADHTVDEWFNIILNMGLDTGYTYLNQITNFNTAIPAEGITQARWEGMLDAVIMWCVNYVGSGDLGVLNGINPTAVAAISGPINKLNFILNTILPLGFVGDAYQTAGTGLDLNKVIDAFKVLLTDFDLTVITDLFGRSTTNWNVLGSTNLVTGVLKLANQILNLVFGTKILQVNDDDAATASLDSVVSQANLKTTVYNLLSGLSTRREAILASALPVVGKLIKGWGTEQEFNTPEHDMGTFLFVGANGTTHSEATSGKGTDCDPYVYSVTEGSLTATIKNTSEGLWRHYVDASGAEHQDNQYKIQLADVKFYNQDGTDSPYVYGETINTTGQIDYGQSGTFTFKVGKLVHSADSSKTCGEGSAIPVEGALVRCDIGYKVYDEFGNAILNGKVFYDRSYIWLSRYNAEDFEEVRASSDSYRTSIYTPIHIEYNDNAIENIKNKEIGSMWRENVTLGDYQTHAINVTSAATVDGMTLSSLSVSMSNKDYETTFIRLFDTYTQDFYSSDGATILAQGSVKGGIDEAAFNSAVTLDRVTSLEGYKAEWTVQLVTKNETKNDVKMIVRLYDSEYKALLQDLVNDENRAMRLKDDYLQTGTVVANEALVNEDAGNDADKTFKLRETNFAPNADGVTEINCAQAWTNYYNALTVALRAGLQEWNQQAVYNYRQAYRDLRVAVNDLEFCRNTSGGALDSAVDSLKTQLLAAQAETTDLYDYTDYKMYRLNRFNDARDDANYYINLKADAAPANVTYIDEYFDYNWMEENDYLALIAGHEKETWLETLLKPFSEEEIASKTQWLANKKIEYANAKELDLAMASNYLTITKDRLLKRDVGVINTQLVDEVSSAMNMIGDQNNGRYTEESWANYADALASAQAAQTSDSQKEIFAEKYNLLVMRKRLVEVDNAGDYNELKVLIKHAEFALSHSNLYSNEAYDFARVLAELGMDPIAHADGYDVQLFPGSAYLTLERGYGADDQGKIDNASRALKEALARLRFKTFGQLVGAQSVDEATLVEADEEKNIEAVISTVATIDENLTPEEVAGMLSIEDADGNTVQVDEITVSADVNYGVTFETYKPLEGFAGTNATVTFYQNVDGVNIPVKTVKLLVPGDINSDGTVDVLDASYAALLAADKGELEGIYLLAGDLAGADKAITVDDYAQFVNKVRA